MFPEWESPVPSTMRGEDGSGAVSCKSATVDGMS